MTRRQTSHSANKTSGYRVETVVAESSDYPAVTNSVMVYDFLGRAVNVAAPFAHRTLYGHELESAGADSAALSTYDGFGRAVSQTVTNGTGTLSTSAIVSVPT